MENKYFIFRDRWQTFLAVCGISLVSCLTYLGQKPSISSDMAWYLSHGLNIAKGIGYVGPELGTMYVERGPLFPFLIAIALKISQTPEAAMWVVRGSAILVPILLFVLGRSGRQQLAGAIAALLYVSTWSVNYYSLRHIDSVLPVPILVSVILLIRSFTGKGRGYGCAIGAGVSLGAAYLIKESALLFFSVPMVGVLIWYRSFKRILPLATTSTLVAMMPVLLWLAVAYQQTGQISILGAQGGDVGSILVNKFSEATEAGISGIYYFIAGLINKMFLNPIPFGWLNITGIGYLIYRACKKGGEFCRIILFCIILQAPIVVYSSVLGWRFGHNLIFFQFNFLATGLMLTTLANRLTVIAKQAWVRSALTVVMIVIWVGVQFFVPNGKDRTNTDFLSASIIGRKIGISGSYSKSYDLEEKKFKPILQRLAKEEKVTTVMIDSPTLAHKLYFYSDARHRFTQIPWILCLFDKAVSSSYSLTAARGRPLYFRHSKEGGISILVFPNQVNHALENQDISHFISTRQYEGAIVNALSRGINRENALQKIGQWSLPSNKLKKITLWRINYPPRLGEVKKVIFRGDSRRRLKKMRKSEERQYRIFQEQLCRCITEKACETGNKLDWLP